MRWSDFIDATVKAVRRSPDLDRAARARNEAKLREAVSIGEDSNGTRPSPQAEALVARLALMEQPYEAWKRGETHPTDDYFDSVWAGNGRGFSRQHVIERLSTQRAIIDDLQTGRRFSRDITGISVYGSAEAEIIDNLRESVITFEEALLCSGRNLSVNQTLVLQKVKSSRH